MAAGRIGCLGPLQRGGADLLVRLPGRNTRAGQTPPSRPSSPRTERKEELTALISLSQVGVRYLAAASP